jgi:hypothetical protein
MAKTVIRGTDKIALRVCYTYLLIESTILNFLRLNAPDDNLTKTIFIKLMEEELIKELIYNSNDFYENCIRGRVVLYLYETTNPKDVYLNVFNKNSSNTYVSYDEFKINQDTFLLMHGLINNNEFLNDYINDKSYVSVINKYKKVENDIKELLYTNNELDKELYYEIHKYLKNTGNKNISRNDEFLAYYTVLYGKYNLLMYIGNFPISVIDKYDYKLQRYELNNRLFFEYNISSQISDLIQLRRYNIKFDDDSNKIVFNPINFSCDRTIVSATVGYSERKVQHEILLKADSIFMTELYRVISYNLFHKEIKKQLYDYISDDQFIRYIAYLAKQEESKIIIDLLEIGDKSFILDMYLNSSLLPNERKYFNIKYVRTLNQFNVYFNNILKTEYSFNFNSLLDDKENIRNILLKFQEILKLCSNLFNGLNNINDK